MRWVHPDGVRTSFGDKAQGFGAERELLVEEGWGGSRNLDVTQVSEGCSQCPAAIPGFASLQQKTWAAKQLLLAKLHLQGSTWTGPGDIPCGVMRFPCSTPHPHSSKCG